MSKRQKQHNQPILSWQVREAALRILETHLPLDIQGWDLDDRKLWDILIYASVTGTSIESACNELSDTPSGNTVREHLNGAFLHSRFEVMALEEELNEALGSQLPKRLLRRFPVTAYEISIDLTEIPYHGQPDQDSDEIRRSQARSGTTHFHTYATLAIVHHKKRYEFALTFVWADERMDEVVQRLLQQAVAVGLRIQRAYLDKGFCSQKVFDVLRWHDIPYLIPIPIRGKSGGIRRLCAGRKSYRTTYTFYANNLQKAYTTEVMLIRRLNRGHYTWMAFACYRMDHIPLHQIFDLYRRRFGIESGYRQLHQTRARTTSRNPVLRLLFVGLALILYNVYITLRQVCQTTRHYGSRTRKIWLTFKRMTRLLQRWIERLLDVIPIHQTTTDWMTS